MSQQKWRGLRKKHLNFKPWDLLEGGSCVLAYSAFPAAHAGFIDLHISGICLLALYHVADMALKPVSVGWIKENSAFQEVSFQDRFHCTLPWIPVLHKSWVTGLEACHGREKSLGLEFGTCCLATYWSRSRCYSVCVSACVCRACLLSPDQKYLCHLAQAVSCPHLQDTPTLCTLLS